MKPSHWIGLLALTLCLTGCSLPPASDSSGDNVPASSSQSSFFNPSNTFKNPQAQALARAAQDNNVAEVRRLMKDEHVNPDVLFSDDGARTPLIAWPVITHSLAGLKAMLDNGANPNARDPKVHRFCVGTDCETKHNYENAMVHAAMTEDPAYLLALLEHGGDPNTKNTNEETLLFQAYIWHNQWPNVQVLVEHGADINAITQGESILDDYTSMGNFKPAYWLLQHGANPKALDPRWKPNPGEVIRYPTVEDIFYYPEQNPEYIALQKQCQRWLLDHGIPRPPISDAYREFRKGLGYPYDDKNPPSP